MQVAILEDLKNQKPKYYEVIGTVQYTAWKDRESFLQRLGTPYVYLKDKRRKYMAKFLKRYATLPESERLKEHLVSLNSYFHITAVYGFDWEFGPVTEIVFQWQGNTERF